jgi:putative tryptophan/tyrosine transport system substrate-binding protein
MRRREFITVLGGAVAAWPLAARAQQPVLSVGWLSGRSSEIDALVLPAFRRGLNAQGYFEGQNVAIEFRWAEGRMDQRLTLAADLIRHRVNVIVAPGTPMEAMQAVHAVNSTIPIVFVSGGDAVQMGIVDALNRPGGNITGVIAYQREFAPKRLELLDQLLPGGAMIAVLENPADFLESPDLLEAARSLGKKIRVLNATNEREIDMAFESLAQVRADALLVSTQSLFFTRAHQIIALASRLRMPTLYYRREFAVAGGLMSYGSSTEEVYRVLGEYTGRLLNGQKPSDLPVQRPTKFELVINLKTAKALGLDVPRLILLRADEVIE